MGTRGKLLLGLAEVDGALARLDADSAGVSANLVALESHAGTRFLDAAALSGVSAVRWAEAKAKIALIWSWFAAYRDVLNRAHLVRSRPSRPGAQELRELTELLQGNVIALGTADLPIEHRDLLGPLVTTTATSLPRLIPDMTACFREVTAVVAVAELRHVLSVTRLPGSYVDEGLIHPHQVEEGALHPPVARRAPLSP
ncbi:hypothetical protein [Lentzea sp. NPDC004782]|uniref:hypothetical protein n=1 Tax=Lentzea sp. NPDC004782 TaxID=3154458 RepID=UPI0033A54B9F